MSDFDKRTKTSRIVQSHCIDRSLTTQVFQSIRTISVSSESLLLASRLFRHPCIPSNKIHFLQKWETGLQTRFPDLLKYQDISAIYWCKIDNVNFYIDTTIQLWYYGWIIDPEKRLFIKRVRETILLFAVHTLYCQLLNNHSLLFLSLSLRRVSHPQKQTMEFLCILLLCHISLVIISIDIFH